MEFPKILVINLGERTDRWKHIQDEFEDWPEPLHRISAVKRTIGWKGCTLSHKKAVQYAKDHVFPWVLVLEDDCQLEKNALHRFQEVLPILWEQRSDWDIFMGGISYTGDHSFDHGRVIQDHPSLLQIKGYAAHFCLIHDGTYDKILRMKMEKMDVFYADHLRLWTTLPYLAIQAPSHSNIEKTYTNYSESFGASTRRFKKTLTKWRKTHKHS
jgi:hypothetical protein